ncbi:dihydrolipoamide acetyltransferase family protein [Roseibium marinum]|uniref:Dihydrolipoamide acetyltransferase component of pyruvate dehydrogenase complex n=1 Tax=Roseibium marinum TaxID=281252 RepID=A0A2S3UP44_9HYPH|nr:dihydrolipoamide acetyltransferase family protein [Roseibium marinum]POF29444.1 pyruvate dehydrogenase E2 component (dihydrolipoamide acetyltransferase) [Roseibium marinum]
MGEFRMPSLGADMEAGKLVEWLVEPGEKVRHGDIVAVVETQKGAIEIEVFEDGVFERPLVELGAKVPVGTPLAIIQGREPESEAEAEVVPPTAPTGKPDAVPRPSAVAPQIVPAETRPQTAPVQPAETGTKASPAARKLAEAHNLNIAALAGSGPEGAIVLADVEAAIGVTPKTLPETPRPEKPAQKKPASFDFNQMRAAIAAAMARSKREIPHYYLQDTVDVSVANDWLTRTNADRPPTDRLLLGALYVKASALAAKKYPEFNGFFGESGFEASDRTHIGVAISIRGGGLVAPAIHDTADMSLDAVMTSMRDLVARVRAGRFRSSEIADPTLTVSSLGERGVEALYGVIYPPQVAIVGFGKATERPWVVAGEIVPRLMVTTTLAADHRVSDGHRGAMFLSQIGKLLQEPEAL